MTYLVAFSSLQSRVDFLNVEDFSSLFQMFFEHLSQSSEDYLEMYQAQNKSLKGFTGFVG